MSANPPTCGSERQIHKECGLANGGAKVTNPGNSWCRQALRQVAGIALARDAPVRCPARNAGVDAARLAISTPPFLRRLNQGRFSHLGLGGWRAKTVHATPVVRPGRKITELARVSRIASEHGAPRGAKCLNNLSLILTALGPGVFRARIFTSH